MHSARLLGERAGAALARRAAGTREDRLEKGNRWQRWLGELRRGEQMWSGGGHTYT
jgi:hypothetical protein